MRYSPCSLARLPVRPGAPPAPAHCTGGGAISNWIRRFAHGKVREKPSEPLRGESRLCRGRLPVTVPSRVHTEAFADRGVHDALPPLRPLPAPPGRPSWRLDPRMKMAPELPSFSFVNSLRPIRLFRPCRGYSAGSGTGRGLMTSLGFASGRDLGSGPDSICGFGSGSERPFHEKQSGADCGPSGGGLCSSGAAVASEASSAKEEEGLDLGGWRSLRKKMMTGAALASHDSRKARVPYHHLLRDADLQQDEEGLEKRYTGVGGEGEVDHDSFFTQRRFDEFNISPLTIKALTSAGYEYMTVVQEAALPVCLDGRDALVKARAGTGKSTTFLLPTIETVLKASSDIIDRVPPILSLVLCPTRELASQIAAETKVFLKYHDGVNVQTLIGGTRFKVDQQRLESNPPQIIVATPGRLLDHIENKSGFSMRLMSLKVLVIDEADHLLDLGFRSDIEKIIDSVPRQRQTLLFSATTSKEVRRISQVVLKREHAFIDTVGLRGRETHAKVLQSCMVAPHEEHFQIVYHLLNEHVMQEVEYKVIVFCTTAMVTSLMFIFLRNMKMNVREMHSHKPQLYRTRISDEFRNSKRLILVTSDVSAHGVNYPDVTLVIQAGIPLDREHYIHRLGRTGREGKNGKGILLLAPWEDYFVNEIKDLQVEKCSHPVLDSDAKKKVEAAMQDIDIGIKEAAYHAWLGYYNSIRDIGRDKTMLVEMANKFCSSIGLEHPPSLFRKTVLKMGLKGISGIRTRK